jgi:SAM-dependent methyltransferase
MQDLNEYVRNLYLTDEYIIKNPSLHEEDLPWKVSKIIPLVDRFIGYIGKAENHEINLLDVGGGAGLILDAVSVHIEESHSIEVNKFALDLSPRALEVQKKANSDLRMALNEDIRKTSLGDKEINLTLMIDILEHVPNPTEALEEVKRISDFVIFKVPLENRFLTRTWNFVRHGEPRRCAIETSGHINLCDFGKLEHQVEKHAGQILDFCFTNVFDYRRSSELYKSKMSTRNRLMDFAAAQMFELSPKLCSLIFNDFVMLLVRCD